MSQILTKIKALNEFQPHDEERLVTLENYFLLFLTGAIIGWIYELFFYWIFENRISNNGFFYGPYLPIYGFGTLFLILFTLKVKQHPAAIFLLSIPITGILEYLTGYVMYAIWATRWWDYRNLFMNIGGYVCLRSVLSFAVGAIILIYVVEPVICMLSQKMSRKARNILCIVIIAVFVIDIIATILFRMPAFA